jgi:broad specificity phosphatase PhoE
MKTTFYLIRHGQTAWNAIEKMQGHSDIPLDDTGREQAAALAEKLKDIYATTIFTSPLGRAQETANILGNILHLSVSIDEGLKERRLGNLEGKTKEEMKAFYPDWNTMTSEQKFTDNREGTESGKDTTERIKQVLATLAEKHPDETVLLITHGGNIRFTLIGLGYGDTESVRGIKNCGYAVIEYNKGIFSIVTTDGIKS